MSLSREIKTEQELDLEVLNKNAHRPEKDVESPRHLKQGASRRPLIEIEGVSKTYQSRSGPVPALDEINTDIGEGEFVCVVGPSGCGKSTLMMLIAGLVPATKGTIRIGGSEVDGPYTDLGIVFQRDLLMPWRSTLDNVLVQAEFRREPRKTLEPMAKRLLSMVGLDGFESKLPHELSGGMRQRVAICRALVHNPDLLLMDEPFGALDALTREQLNLDVQDIWQRAKKTVVFITHSISEAVFLGDRVLVVGPRPGRVVDELRVDLARPRSEDIRETPEFGAYTHRIRNSFLRMGVIRKSSASGLVSDLAAGEDR